MEHPVVWALVGFVIGTLGTLIGAGGGFILVPILIIVRPDLDPGTITAISMAVVAANAISGSGAYMYKRRVDYKAGLIFALVTIPGSILGVWTVRILPRHTFDVVFSVLLIVLAAFLLVRGGKKKTVAPVTDRKGWIYRRLVDREGETFDYSFNLRNGSLLSVVVGYVSPLLGIGGGIIHVPAMVEWLRFPVHVATATSHFILAIMATVTVATHYYEGAYDNPEVLQLVFSLAVGVIPGAQLGAYLSGKLQGKAIIRALAVSLILVGIRILLSA